VLLLSEDEILDIQETENGEEQQTEPPFDISEYPWDECSKP
jgi:hypothetical protein